MGSNKDHKAILAVVFFDSVKEKTTYCACGGKESFSEKHKNTS